MFLVSKLKFAYLFAIICLCSLGGVFLTSTDSASANTPHPQVSQSAAQPSNPHYSFSSVSSVKQTRVESVAVPTAVTVRPTAFWDDWDSAANLLNDIACSNAIGVGVSAATGVCDDGFYQDTVIEGVVDAAQCAADPTGCLTEWLLEQAENAADWGINGVLGLALSVHDECLPSGGSASWNAQTNVACDTRVSQDYFFADGGVRRTVDAVAASRSRMISRINSQRVLLRAQGKEDTDEYRDLSGQLSRLTGSANLNASQTAQANNQVFFTPKSALTTPVFNREYKKFAVLAALLLVPMVIAGALQSVVTGKPAVMLRSVFFHLPLAMIGVFVARYVVRTLMALTDAFSAFIVSDMRDDVQGFFGGAQGQFRASATILMPIMIIAIIFLFGSIMVWFVLSMREASVAIITVFLPVAFAASVWPALGKWIIRAIKLLVAAIISKIFIVGAISLGVGTFANSTSAAGTTVSLSHMVFGATIFFIASFSPHLVMKFFDEIGDALNAAGGTGAMQRALSASGNTNGTRQLFAGMKGGGNAAALGKGGGGGGGTGPGGGGGSDPPSFRQARKAEKADRKAGMSFGKKIGLTALALTPPGAVAVGIASGAARLRDRSKARQWSR